MITPNGSARNRGLLPASPEELELFVKKAVGNLLGTQGIERAAVYSRGSQYTRLQDFLSELALLTSVSPEDAAAEEDQETVKLSTIHQAKGLEWSTVFIIGLNDGRFPSAKSLKTNYEEEERRLFYVGMTRAKDLLWLTGAYKRKLYTKIQEQEASRFLADIPRTCCEWFEKAKGTPVLHPPRPGGETPKSRYSYVTGCRVKHPKWGIGVIRDCYGEGDEQKVMVNFPPSRYHSLEFRPDHLAGCETTFQVHHLTGET